MSSFLNNLFGFDLSKAQTGILASHATKLVMLLNFFYLCSVGFPLDGCLSAELLWMELLGKQLAFGEVLTHLSRNTLVNVLFEAWSELFCQYVLPKPLIDHGVGSVALPEFK